MSKAKNILLGAGAGVLSFMAGDLLERGTSIPSSVSRLIGAVIAISIYLAVYSYFKNKQSK